MNKFFRNSFLSSVFILLLFQDINLSAQKNVFREIEEEYGITVKTRIGKNFFPPEWLDKPILARAKPIKSGELPRMAAVLKTALARYPKEFVQQHIKVIALCGDLSFYNTVYGASNYVDTLYLNNKGEEHGYTDSYLEGSIHHELTHILLDKYRFNFTLWQRENPKSFKYGKGGLDAIKSGKASLYGTKELYQKGFLSEYSLSSSEEDVCVYSERILTDFCEFEKLRNSYKAVERKYMLWLDFYRAKAPDLLKTALFCVSPDSKSGENIDSDDTPRMVEGN